MVKNGQSIRLQIMFRLVLSMILAASAAIAPTSAQEKAATQNKVVLSAKTKTFHAFGRLSKLRFQTNADAQALVDDILAVRKLKSSYRVLVTDNNKKTPNASAGYNPDTDELEILFNVRFMELYARRAQNNENMAMYFAAAHEVAHLMAAHYERRLNPHDQELEADYFAGFALGKRFKDCEGIAAAVRAFPDEDRSESHPARARRVVAAARGCADGTNGELDPKLALLAPANVSSILSRFEIRRNRELFGSDVVMVAGRQGIPGSTMESCAQICYSIASCRAFSFNVWRGWCYLKDNAAGRTYLNASEAFGVKKPIQLAADPQRGKVVMYDRLRQVFPEEPYDTAPADSFAACKLRCLEPHHGKCMAVSFHKTRRQCKLFEQSNGPYQEEAYDSAFKQEPPSAVVVPAGGR